MTTGQRFDWSGIVDYAGRAQVEVPKTQYQLPGITAEYHPRGIPVEVPPLWHTVVTGRLAFPPEDGAALQAAQVRLATALDEIERVYPITPHGIFIQVAYGLPYFRERIPAAIVEEHMPKSMLPGTEGQWAVVDSIRFPKDPMAIALERNDIAFHFMSDFGAHVDNVVAALFRGEEHTLNGIPVDGVYLGDLLQVTTIRRGFVGHNMPKLMGERAGIPGAEKIPDGSMLFMGFTSTGADTVAFENTPSFETIPGFTDLTPDSYFAHGTAMHLSRTATDIAKWYARDPQERLHRMYHPRRSEDPEALTHWSVPLPFPRERGVLSFDPDEFINRLLEYDADRHGVIGHGMQVHGVVRLLQGTISAYGEWLSPGTVYFLRQDFNSIENPFSFSTEDEIDPTPHAGLHFVGFGPSSQHYQVMRLLMDSADLQQRYDLPDSNVALAGFTTTTHRQNLLLPPRAHRSMPLAELM